MSKIQKYDACDCGYNSCHEPIRKDNGDYIKVSELRERFNGRIKELSALTKLDPSEKVENEVSVAVMELSILLAALDSKEDNHE